MDLTLANAFSLNMLEFSGKEATVEVRRVDDPAGLILANSLVGNSIGHPDTDRVVRKMLEQDGVDDIPVGTRDTIALVPGTNTGLLVAQYRGPRLPEGATCLPDGATIEWYLVTTTRPAPTTNAICGVCGTKFNDREWGEYNPTCPACGNV